MWNSGVIVIGCRHNTLEFIEQILSKGRALAGVVTIGQATAEKNNVPTWVDLSAYFRGRFPVYMAQSYTLHSPQDRKYLECCRASFGFCIGWQRIIPQWFLNTVQNGIYGMHACQFFLPRGRGRSPVSWAFIHGADIIHAHVFRYTSGADEGQNLAIETIPITSHDDINSIQQKCRIIFNQVVERYWEPIEKGTADLFEGQPDVPDLFYPKRSPEDGYIDWSLPVEALYNFVRAQTRPYPGAFTYHQDKKFHIWRAVPFGLPSIPPKRPGTIVEAFYDRTLVVQAGDGLLHLLDHELPETVKNGDTLV